MNTRKQVLIMTALLLMMLIIVGVYAAWLPSRETTAASEFQDITAERGAILFSKNCRACHGDVGEGGSLGGRVAAAPSLDRADLQGFIDAKTLTSAAINATTTTIAVKDSGKFKTTKTILIDDERMNIKGIDGNNLMVERAVSNSEASAHDSGAPIQLLDPDTLRTKQAYVTNTITCGHVGTDMQPWAAKQGGTLSDEQIRQLMTLITQRYWDILPTENNLTDKLVTKLLDPVTTSDTSIHVSDVSVFTVKQVVRIGDERLRVTSVPILTKDASGALPKDRSGFVRVERKVLNSLLLDHEPDEQIYNFLVVFDPDGPPPAILQSSCGQTAQAPAPAGTPELIEPFTGQTISVVAFNTAFDTKTITVKTGGKVRVRLTNKDNATEHNIAFYKSSTDTTPVSTGSVGLRFAGSSDGTAVDDTAFDVPAAASYFFRCDVHPTIMTGTLTVTP